MRNINDNAVQGRLSENYLTRKLSHDRHEIFAIYGRCDYRMAGNFRGKSEKALAINFRGFKFRDSNQSMYNQ